MNVDERMRELNRLRGYDPDEPTHEEDGTLIMSKRYIAEFLKKNPGEYYRTKHLNNKLYLHYKGFGKI